MSIVNNDRTLAARQNQDFDLNLAPIIDCFVVLIAFVMISTAFASIGILDAGIAAGGRTSANTALPEVRVLVELGPQGDIGMRLSGKESLRLTVQPLANGKPDTASLEKRLSEIKIRWPSLQKVQLSAGNKVSYQDVVTSVETIRRSVPGVALAGF